MEWRQLIEERADVMLGKPVFKGTRITVEHVLAELGNGMSEKDLLAGHPRLSRDHVLAAMSYAADVLKLDRIVA